MSALQEQAVQMIRALPDSEVSFFLDVLRRLLPRNTEDAQPLETPEDTRRPLTYEEVVAALEEANAEAQKPGYEESLIDHETFIKNMRRIANGLQD